MSDAKSRKIYAHSREGAPEQDWHLLEDHLRSTAERAGKFASVFGMDDWGYLAGLWHDLGKYGDDFQKRLRLSSGAGEHLETCPGRVDHSTAGALHAVQKLVIRELPVGRLLAYCLAGHHAGLSDWLADEAGNKALAVRLRNVELLESVRRRIPSEILDQRLPRQFPKGFDLAFFVRMIYSCLVDADFLDTERFMDPARAAKRIKYPDLNELARSFDRFMEGKKARASDTPVNRLRDTILNQCREKARSGPGIFSLTVPTGGGKTLSSMAFALRHAMLYGKRRILYVIPYTSIIEQTADQFREIFGSGVIEHHSNLDSSDETRETASSRLACENWDAPIIVTTSVQFFESLFANRSSRCRKLHNIANSVVVLDEAQLLPPEFLHPILHAIDELRKNYRVTFLISTATQPALGPHPELRFKGLEGVSEIVSDPQSLHTRMKRVRLHLPSRLTEPREWEDLAGELAGHSSVLCVVNRRDDARALWQLMPPGSFHLSALMCGEHRSAKIAEIRERLAQGVPTRVISTQLVEAGVDLDFPVVYRALAGLDSIAQAAGRCNREGRLESGQVSVFIPPTQPPAGILRQAEGQARQLLGEDVPDHLAPDRFERFFRMLYWLQGDRLDKYAVLEDLVPAGEKEFRYSFRSAAFKFRLIDDNAYRPVLVRYGDGNGLIGRLESMGPESWILRRLQRFTVNLGREVHRRLVESGGIREVHPGLFVQVFPELYDDHLGFVADRKLGYEPDELIC